MAFYLFENLTSFETANRQFCLFHFLKLATVVYDKQYCYIFQVIGLYILLADETVAGFGSTSNW
jgi:hypothetical protein